MTDLRVRFPRPCGEEWQKMVPTGCHRTCATCDKVVHDLSQHEASEIEALLRDAPDTCVRARIDSLGVVETKAGAQSGIRRIVIAIGASAGLLISQPVAAREKHPARAIIGQTSTFGFKIKVVATDASGNAFRATVRDNGRYKIKNIPAGTYTLEFVPDCGDRWTIENVVVAEGDTVVPDRPNAGQCIVVGKLEIEDHRA